MRSINFEKEIELLENTFYLKRPVTKQLIPEYSILFVFNECSFEDIEYHCSSKKVYFLRKRLLVGKFHPEYQMHILDDNTVFISPPPHPIIAIRELIKQDFRFLKYANASDSKIKNYVEVYEEMFGRFRKDDL